MNLLIPEVTAEECAEVIQAIMKMIRFGDTNTGYNNKKALEEEVGQLKYMLDMLVLHYHLDWHVIHQAACDKSRALTYQARFNVCNQNLAGT